MLSEYQEEETVEGEMGMDMDEEEEGNDDDVGDEGIDDSRDGGEAF